MIADERWLRPVEIWISCILLFDFKNGLFQKLDLKLFRSWLFKKLDLETWRKLIGHFAYYQELNRNASGDAIRALGDHLYRATALEQLLLELEGRARRARGPARRKRWVNCNTASGSTGTRCSASGPGLKRRTTPACLPVPRCRQRSRPRDTIQQMVTDATQTRDSRSSVGVDNGRT